MGKSWGDPVGHPLIRQAAAFNRMLKPPFNVKRFKKKSLEYNPAITPLVS
jgi:hypothetical protein